MTLHGDIVKVTGIVMLNLGKIFFGRAGLQRLVSLRLRSESHDIVSDNIEKIDRLNKKMQTLQGRDLSWGDVQAVEKARKSFNNIAWQAEGFLQDVRSNLAAGRYAEDGSPSRSDVESLVSQYEQASQSFQELSGQATEAYQQQKADKQQQILALS